MSTGDLHVLFLARNFPNPARNHIGQPVLGLARALTTHAGIGVRAVSPLPRVPPGPVWGLWRALRAVPEEREESGIQVYHPRQIVGLGQTLFRIEGDTYLRAVRPLVERLHREWRIDLLHAHYVYPDGYAAARLSAETGIPFLITERAFWRPWLPHHTAIRDKALWAARRAARLVAVSEALRQDLISFTGEPERAVVVPNGVDAAVFACDGTPPPREGALLYVGWLTYHKGLDLLVRAMPAILQALPGASLTVIGRNLYRPQRRQEREIRQLADQIGVAARIRYLGERSPAEVAAAIRRSTLLVSPSQRESFGAVVIEALACGRPVVATRSGGPAEILSEEVGKVVPLDDPAALAEAVVTVTRGLDGYDPARIHAYALERFSWERVAARMQAVYHEAFGHRRERLPG